MPSNLDHLKSLLMQAGDLRAAEAVLSWDQTTYMPSGGAPARGRQMAILARLAHEKFTDPEIGRLLDELAPYEQSLPYDSDDASLVRVTRREYERAIRVPAEFVARENEHASASYQAWTVARPANDFAAVAALLEKTHRAQPRTGQLLPRLRAHRRPAHRDRRLRHASQHHPAAVCRAARAAPSAGGGHRRPAAGGRRLPAPAVSRSPAA